MRRTQFIPAMQDKATLRQTLREHLRALDEPTRAAASAQIASHILSWAGDLASGQTWALFGGLRNEPDLVAHLLPGLLSGGVRVCFFHIEKEELLPRVVRCVDDLKRGAMNVWEPQDHCMPVPVSELDVILVPGLAFTRTGARLGRGGGYYDRLLAQPQCRARRIAVAFELQIIDGIPCEAHDQRVAQIITESGLIEAVAS